MAELNIRYYKNDGGRSLSAFRGKQGCGDCVVRAISIVTAPRGVDRGEWYKLHYDLIAKTKRSLGLKASARDGSPAIIYGPIYEKFGFRMKDFTHEAWEEHKKRAILHAPGHKRLGGHVAAVLDGAIHDAFDCRERYNTEFHEIWGYDPEAERKWKDLGTVTGAGEARRVPIDIQAILIKMKQIKTMYNRI